MGKSRSSAAAANAAGMMGALATPANAHDPKREAKAARKEGMKILDGKATIPGLATGETLERIPIDRVKPDPGQYRRTFPPAELQELADSIRANGQSNPAKVYRDGKRYILMNGERRWRACQLAGVDTLWAVVLPTKPDAVAIKIEQLTDNLQRQDVNPIEEAAGIAEILMLSGMQGKDLAARLGISPAKVTRAVALTKLPVEVRQYVTEGSLSPSAAYCLSQLDESEELLELAEEAVEKGLTRDQVDAGVRKILAAKSLPGQGRLPFEFTVPPRSKLLRFAVLYPGALPAYSVEAASREEAERFVGAQHPAGIEWSLSDDPAHLKGRWMKEAARALPANWSVTDDLWTRAKADVEAGRTWAEDDLRATEEFIARRAEGDAVPRSGEWSEFDVALDDGTPVRVVYKGDKSKVHTSLDGQRLELFGPIGGRGEFSFWIGTKDAPAADRMGLRAFAQSAARQTHADWLRDFLGRWEARKGRDTDQWLTGPGRFIAVDGPQRLLGETAGGLHGEIDGDDEEGPTPANRPSANGYEPPVAGWEKPTEWHDAGDVDYAYVTDPAFESDSDQGVSVILPGPLDWSKLAGLLERAAAGARYRALLAGVAGGPARPGDRVELTGGTFAGESGTILDLDRAEILDDTRPALLIRLDGEATTVEVSEASHLRIVREGEGEAAS